MNEIVVSTDTFECYGYDTEEDFATEGAVKIICTCSFSGYVDCDYDGAELFGNCKTCDSPFSVSMYQ